MALALKAWREVSEAIVDVIEEGVDASSSSKRDVVRDLPVAVGVGADVSPANRGVNALVPGLVLGSHEEVLCLVDDIGTQLQADLKLPVQPVEDVEPWGTMAEPAASSNVLVFLLDEIAAKFTELKIIIGSMGTPFVEQTLAMITKHKNVYADLTIQPSMVWQIYNMIVAAQEQDVMDKLLFGSGFPRNKPDECIEVLLGFNKLLADTNLPTVPRGNIRSIIERDSLALLGIQV